MCRLCVPWQALDITVISRSRQVALEVMFSVALNLYNKYCFDKLEFDFPILIIMCHQVRDTASQALAARAPPGARGSR